MKLSFLFILSFIAIASFTSCKKKTYLCECKDPAKPNHPSIIGTVHATSKSKAQRECQNEPIAAGYNCNLQ